MLNAALDKAVKDINKKFGEGTILKASDLEYIDAPRLKTGSLSLDIATNGGWPRGLMTEVFGPASSGKTTLTFFTIAQAQRDGLSCVFIDAEDSFGQHNADYVKNCGVDFDSLLIIKSNKAEDVLDMIKQLISTDTPPDLIVLDSIAAIMPREDIEKEMDTPTMATRARLLSRGLGAITSLNKRRTTFIFLNQIRSSMSMYGSPITTPGGNSMKHYMALKVQMTAGEPITQGKVRVGHQVKFKVVKSKVGPPFQSGDFKLYYNGTIDKHEEIFTLGCINEVITRGGAWYEFEGQKALGREGFLELLKSDEELYKKLEKKLL